MSLFSGIPLYYIYIQRRRKHPPWWMTNQPLHSEIFADFHVLIIPFWPLSIVWPEHPAFFSSDSCPPLHSNTWRIASGQYMRTNVEKIYKECDLVKKKKMWECRKVMQLDTDRRGLLWNCLKEYLKFKKDKKTSDGSVSLRMDYTPWPRKKIRFRSHSFSHTEVLIDRLDSPRRWRVVGPLTDV